MRKSAWIIISWLTSFSFVQAASFDCDSAQTSQEISLCLGREFRDSDAKINQVYSKLMAKLSDADKATLRKNQRAWIKERESVCNLYSKESIMAKLFARLGTLVIVQPSLII